MAELSGDTAKFRVITASGQLAFRMASGSVEVAGTGGGGNLNNTEDEYFTKAMVTKGTLRFSFVNASYDPVENYYFNPPAIFPGAYASIIIYVNGLQDSVNTYVCTRFLWVGCSHNFDATNLQPFSGHGESSQGFLVPGYSTAQSLAALINFFIP